MVPLVLSPNRHATLIASLERGNCLVARSRHFALYRPDDEIVLVHQFGLPQINNNLGYYVANELLPLLADELREQQGDDSFAYSEQDLFEQLVGAVVRSVDGNERRAWQRFYDNSLAALALAMADSSSILDFIWPFGAIYRQAAELICGQTLLDAGTCFGFLPLLLARHTPCPARIVGCDLDSALIGFANACVARQQLAGVQFVQADILAGERRAQSAECGTVPFARQAPSAEHRTGETSALADSSANSAAEPEPIGLARLGMFDTVTAIHVIEHLEAAQTARALVNLWRVCQRRLIVAVPLEETPDPRFGHRQVFDQERLLALGAALGGNCRYFEHHGGWLVVDRVTSDQ